MLEFDEERLLVDGDVHLVPGQTGMARIEADAGTLLTISTSGGGTYTFDASDGTWQ